MAECASRRSLALPMLGLLFLALLFLTRSVAAEEGVGGPTVSIRFPVDELNWVEIESVKEADSGPLGIERIRRRTFRLKVPSGWLVRIDERPRTEEDGIASYSNVRALTFVPDPAHEWKY